MLKRVRGGFTLVEMLVVIGIISILVGVSLASFNKMMKTADKAKAQELVSEVVTALTAIYESDGAWPKRIRENSGANGRLDENVAVVLGNRGFMSLTMADGKLAGKDRFGIVTPWAEKVIERLGTKATLTTPVGANATVEDHILHYAVDLDGDGLIENVGDGKATVRATAAVWCIGKDNKKDDKSLIKSWTVGQEKATK